MHAHENSVADLPSFSRSQFHSQWATYHDMLPSGPTPLQRAALANVLTNQRQTSDLQREAVLLHRQDQSLTQHERMQHRKAKRFPKLDDPWACAFQQNQRFEDRKSAADETFSSFDRSASCSSTTTSQLSAAASHGRQPRAANESSSSQTHGNRSSTNDVLLRSRQMLSQQRKAEQQAIRKAFQ